MATRTLRPSGDVANTGWTASTGTNEAAVIDDSPTDDATYMYAAGGSGYMILFDLTDPSPAIPTLAQIRYVRYRVRRGTTGSAAKLVTYLVRPSTDSYFEEQAVGNGIAEFFGINYTTAPSGDAWSIADISALQLRFDENLGTDQLRIYEAWVDVIINEAPVATVTAPAEASSVTTTTRPAVTWTYSDPESDVQERYRVKIFSAAQYGIGGFDPETSPNTWDSGEVFSSATTLNVPIDLVNGTTYRAYVKVADAGSGGRYSAWDNNTFTINVSAPPAPSLVVTAQVANATGPRNKLDITRTSHATPTTYMVIEYTEDAGVTWATVRGAEQIVNSPDGTTFTIYDYEATPNTARGYRAKAVRTV